MPGRNTRDELALQQIKEHPARKERIKEQMKFEIGLLRTILRDHLATDEDKSIAQSQIFQLQGLPEMAADPPATWLRQIRLLADSREEPCSMADEDSLRLATSVPMTHAAWE